MAKSNGFKAKKSDKLAWIIVGILGALGLLVVAAWSTFSFGLVAGEEFSPDTFNRRTYSYYRVPIIRLQVTGIDRTDSTGDFESHLKNNGFVTPQNANNPRWDTIQASVGALDLPPGDASILFRYVNDETAPGGISWVDWTTKNNAAAKVLWPVVAQFARDRLYQFIPDLLAKAGEISDVQEFTIAVNYYTANGYSRMGDARRELGAHAEAVRFYQTALKHEPGHAAARQGLADSQKVLGESASAQQSSKE